MTQCSMYYFKNSEAIFNIRIQDSEQMLACLLVCRTCPKQTVKKGPMMCVKLSCLHHYLASVLTIKRASWFFFFHELCFPQQVSINQKRLELYFVHLFLSR